MVDSAKLFAVVNFLLLMFHQMSLADAFHIYSLILTDQSPPQEHFSPKQIHLAMEELGSFAAEVGRMVE